MRVTGQVLVVQNDPFLPSRDFLASNSVLLPVYNRPLSIIYFVKSLKFKLKRFPTHKWVRDGRK